jgi:hypothetical protein
MVHLEQQIEFLKKPVFHRRDKCRVSFFQIQLAREKEKNTLSVKELDQSRH